MSEIEGMKNVLVTGGTRGIGRSIVEAFAKAGFRVAFTFRSSVDEANSLVESLAADGVESMALQGDASSMEKAAEAVTAVIDAWGSVDVLVNNAGVTRDNLMIRMSEDDWDTVIANNLKSVFNFCKAVYRPMMKQRSGRIINISSVVGVTGNAGQTNYAASKAGMIGFTKSLAKELGSRGVTVNVVAPGFVETDMTADLRDASAEAMVAAIPLKRVGKPNDIAAAVLFLASDGASYITGNTLLVDGGLGM